MTGPVALLGSGEYLPSMEAVERSLVAGRRARMAQLATAAAPEGPASLQRWHALGADAARRLDVEQVVVPVVDRASADDPDVADLIADVGVVYLSGGSPTFLAETLRGSRVWAAIEAAWRDGAALAGCSAGAMALCGEVPSVRNPLSPPVAGVGVLPHLRILPHFDAFLGRLPRWTVDALIRAGDGVTVVGIDEETALVGGPERWEVRGRGSAWVLRDGTRRQVPSGRLVDLPDGRG